MLDVGAGTGNATLPAAATGAQVIGTDIAPELMAVGERAARARGLAVTWQVADAQALPFPDAAFDVVLSVVGAMFAPDHEATARELLRVCRPGGTIAMANWTPERRGGPVLRDPRPLRPARPGPGRRRRGAIPRTVTRPVRARDRDHDAVARPAGLRRAPRRAVAYYRAHFPPSGGAWTPTRRPRRWTPS